MSSNIFQLQTGISLLAWVGILAVVAFALLDALTRSRRAFLAADKLNKQAWLIILGVAVLAHLFLGGFLSLISLVAGLVYLLDARPALRDVTRR
ncbi:MAG: DUF2516 family protein [Nocardioidaceae bacterium]